MTELTERDLLERQLEAVRHNHGPDHPDAVRPEHEIVKIDKPPKPPLWQRIKEFF